MRPERDPPQTDEIVDLVAGTGCLFALVAPGDDCAAPFIAMLRPGAPAERIDTADARIGNAIHGYGLPSIAGAGRHVLYTRRNGGGIWRAGAAEAPRRMDAGEGDLAFGDLAWSGETILCVAERTGAATPANVIAAVDPQNGALEVLFDQADFVSRPVIDPASGRFAFLAWRLPHMPWERTSLYVGDIIAGASSVRRIQAPPSALAQPSWAPDGALYVLCDAEGFFDLWRLQGDGLAFVASAGADIGLSLGAQRARSYTFQGPSKVAAVVWDKGVSDIAEIDLNNGRATRRVVDGPPADLIAAAAGDVFHATLPLSGAPSVRSLTNAQRVLWQGRSLEDGGTPVVSTLRFEAADGEAIFANRYPADPERSRGFVVLNLHGGPKSLAARRLSGVLKALWRDGCDIVDLNYRGSAGFGRRYRERIDGAWGVADVEDCVTSIDGLIAQGLARPGRIVLRGSSAGAFTLLNVLARDARVGGGIAYAAVPDLRALGAGTHKYESGYLKTLVGESDLSSPAFEQRSPIVGAARIRAPVLFLHGANDLVAPAADVIRMAERLNANGTKAEIRVLDGEGHSFSKPHSARIALDEERRFIRKLIDKQ